jgi:hypothetical protein
LIFKDFDFAGSDRGEREKRPLPLTTADHSHTLIGGDAGLGG